MRYKNYAVTMLCLSGVLSLGVSGCKSNGNDVQAATDPADINNAPAAGQDPNAPQQAAPQEAAPAQQAYAPAPSAPRRQSAPAPQYSSEQPQQYQAPAPQQYADDSANYSNGSTYNGSYDNDQGSYEAGYEQGLAAAQPPPPLPVYEQPECPQEGYQWTPGYWNYTQSGGYYWVPGVWVAPPYQGSLWTPGYWGLIAGLFRFHQGYWGPHVGYYGGIPYGNGYNGDGFHGGYWNNGNFMYNRSVTNVNTTVIKNVYNYKVVNNTTTIINNRVSYNGGPGGIQARPTPSQLAVLREPHVRPLPQQIAHVQQAQQNRAQFASVNNGRPAVLVAPKPLVLQHIAAAPALANPGIRGEVAHPAGFTARPAIAPARPNEARPAEPAARPNEVRPNEAARPNEARPAPAEVRPNEARPAQPAARPNEARPSAVKPAPAPHPAPQARPEQRPAPQPARPEQRPQVQARPEAQPHPAPRPEAKPEATKPEARPEARPEAKPERPEENRPEPHGRR
jgi:hypothetical protein